MQFLIHLLDDKCVQIRAFAGQALGAIRPEDYGSLNAILEKMRNGNSEAGNALELIRPTHPKIIRAIRFLTADSDPNISERARHILRKDN